MSSSPKMNRSGFVRAEENVQPNDSPAPRAAPRRRAAAAARRAAQTSAKSARKSSGSGPGSRGGKRGKDNSKRASKAVKKAKRKTKSRSARLGLGGGNRPPAKKNSKGQYVGIVASSKRSYKNKPNGARAQNDAKRDAGRQLPQVVARMCAMEEWRTRMRFLKGRGGFRVKNLAKCAVKICILCGWYKNKTLTPHGNVSGSIKCWGIVKQALIAAGFTCSHDFSRGKDKYDDKLTITFTHKDFLEGEDDKIASIVQTRKN